MNHNQMKHKNLAVFAGVAGLALNAASAARAADADYVANSAFTRRVTIAFNGDAEVSVMGAGDGVTCTRSAADIVVHSAAAGVEYLVAGATAAGSVRIHSDEAFKLTLNGANLTCTNGPAIALDTTNRCFVVLAEGTSNALTDSDAYTQKGDGALWSKGPLILSGTGALTVTGRKKHGICGDTYLRVLDGDVVVAAAKDGVHASELFRMDHGSLQVTAAGDGIDAGAGRVEINGGAITIRSAADDVQGIVCGGSLTVNGGAVNLTIDGVQSKGFKSGGEMSINGGALMFNLSGAVYLGTATGFTTNNSVVTTNFYVDPAYSTAMKGDTNMTINAGSITVTHTGLAGKGISADGNLTIRGGVLDLVTTGGCSKLFTNLTRAVDLAAADCIHAGGNLEILGGTLTALSTGNAGDALSADGYAIIGVAGISNTPVLNLATRGQKVALSGSGMQARSANPKAFKAIGDVTVNGGRFSATTRNDGGEGLESKARITINGGTIEITAYDDCINAAKNLAINGGMIYCYSTGNDGIDSNGQMQINGGMVVASGTTAPEEGLDCDMNTFAVKGGTIVGTGGATSTPTTSSCTQCSVLYTTTGTSGLIVQVKSATGDHLVYRIPRNYTGGGGGGGRGGGPGGGGGAGGMVMLFSNPGLAAGATYTVVTGATVTGGTEFHGLYLGATVSGGTTVKTFTTSSTSKVTTVQ